MFSNHQKRIGDYARRDADSMARVFSFVVLTIRERLATIPDAMATLDAARDGDGTAQNEIDSILYGSKRAAIYQIDAEKDSIYWQAESIVYHAESERDAARELIRLFASIHGVGLAKAGFMAQLCYGVGGCLDSHNIERFGINPNAIKSCRYKNAKRLSTRDRILNQYLDLCESFGGAESLWDSWCHYVATRDDPTGFRMNGNAPLYRDAEHVSALHCESLGIAA